MKGAILIMALLVMGIFAGALIMADHEDDDSSVDIEDDVRDEDSGDEELENDSLIDIENDELDDDVVEVSEIATEDIDEEEIEEALEEVTKFGKHKKFGFAKVTVGHGWMTRGDKGHLIRGFWATQKFVAKADESIELKEFIRMHGKIHIAGGGAYNLIKKGESTNESIAFYLVPVKEKVRDVETAEIKSVGELKLEKTRKYDGLSLWTGLLVMDSGRLEGEWDVEIGTNSHFVKPKAVEKTIKKRFFFWERFKFWNRRQTKVKSIEKIDREDVNPPNGRAKPLKKPRP